MTGIPGGRYSDLFTRTKNAVEGEKPDVLQRAERHRHGVIDVRTNGDGTMNASGSGTLTLSGGVTGSGQNLTLTGTGSGVESGVIATTPGTLTKSGTGTWTLSATNSYSGSTTIAAGTLNANARSALGDGRATNTLIFTGGTLQAGGTITSPSTRGVTLTSTGLIDTNNNSVSIAGVIGGSGGLTKSSTGTKALSGSQNYTGVTTISAGTLALGAAGGGTKTPPGTTGGGKGGLSRGGLGLKGVPPG